ncbi:hypothetical protein MrNuV_ORF030 [Macrobrachium rosenbergii nudivirus]|nr:hypothetical protein MrNuV_ORF030 [Macrobrachium rosenbergii nudivirus]
MATFKSLNPEITNTTDIEDIFSEALCYQDMFEHKTSPWEMKNWEYEELEKFQLDPNTIDRVYYSSFNDDVFGRNFNLICRMVYKDAPLYVELIASCDYTGFDCQGGGSIFVSRDANIFINVCMSNDWNKEPIYQSLEEDGIYINKELAAENNPCVRFQNRSPAMLKYLCHQTIYKNKTTLEPYIGELPKLLADSVIEFIKYHEAKYVQDN